MWVSFQDRSLSPRPMSSAPFCCRKTLAENKFNQLGEKVQTQMKAVKQDQMVIVESSDKVKHLLFLFKSYRKYSDPHLLSCLVDTETPINWKKLTT